MLIAAIILFLSFVGVCFLGGIIYAAVKDHQNPTRRS